MSQQLRGGGSDCLKAQDSSELGQNVCMQDKSVVVFLTKKLHLTTQQLDAPPGLETRGSLRSPLAKVTLWFPLLKKKNKCIELKFYLWKCSGWAENLQLASLIMGT